MQRYGYNKGMRLAVIFPGMGYHKDKPLLYYAAKLVSAKGYEVFPVQYRDLPLDGKGSADRLREVGNMCVAQTEEQLAGIDFDGYEKILFIGKSIGTKAALAFRDKHAPNAKAVLLTPLGMTFEHDTSNCIAFHGTSDQWANTAEIERLCRENGVSLYEYESANHSIETDDVFRNIEYLRDVMQKTENFI